MKRLEKIEHYRKLAIYAAEALDEMSEMPDIPTDLSAYPVGIFPILRDMGVDIKIDKDDVFGLMKKTGGK